MKKLIILLMCLCVAIGLLGCHKTRDRSKGETVKEEVGAEVQVDEPLTLYYVENQYHQGVPMLLGWYRTQKGAFKIEATAFNTTQELETALAEEYPDIIMLDKMGSGSALDPFSWVRDGNIAGLNVFMENDTNFDRASYLSGVLEAGTYGGEQYILPLSVANQYLMINESELKTGTLSALGGSFTGEQLLEELIRDSQAHYGDTYFTHIPFYYDLSGMGAWIYEILELTGAMHVDRENSEVLINEEMFALTMEYMKVLINDANLLYGGNVDLNGEDFLSVESYCTAVLSDRNAPYMTRYMGSASHQLLEEEMTILPYALAEGGYAVNINVMGMVSASSDQQEAAYQVLTAMMNVPKDKWETLNVGDTFVQMSSPNQKEALALVDSFAVLDKGNFNVLGAHIKREPLTENQVKILRDMIENNRSAYIVDQNIVGAIEAYVWPYVEMDGADWAQIAQDTAQAIESGM